MKKKILCIILARGGSKGIPLKNIYPINNHPLISYSITAGLNSKYIKDVIVSTDNIEISKTSEKYGAIVPFVRSKKYSTDKALSVDALKYSVSSCEKIFKTKYDFIIELPAVSPFRDHKDIDKALELLFKSKADSVISYVNTGEKHPTRLKRIIKNKVSDFCRDYPEPKKHSRRQDLESCFIRNGAIYAMTRECLFKQDSRQGRNHMPLIMDEEKSVNIDHKFDLLIAKNLIENGNCNNKPILINNHIEIPNKYSTTKKNILCSTPLHFIPNIKLLLSKKFNATFSITQNKKETIRLLKDKKIWICPGCPRYKIDKHLLKHAKNLEVIVTPTTGLSHIDINYCKKNSIKIETLNNKKITKNIYASSEFTFALMFNVLRNIKNGMDVVNSGHWRDFENNLRGNELSGKTVGIIGYGRIGKNLTKYLKPFKTKIFVYDPYKIKDIKNELNCENKKKLLSRSDIIFICINLSPKNYDLINKSWFKHLKKGVIIINTSRGEVVKDTDIIKYIRNGTIKAFATDVIQNEQKNINKNRLVKFNKNNNNIFITPHIAGLTYESESKAAFQTYLNSINYI